ncbi:MAG: hypothetical protein EPN72_01560 [Nevskiaceae bacterium]|nr:MAG: hypothetical protein EPN63_12310 [Nevskiaceae bacterium]TBR74731.1 MAG: hypothetical protein EPN72_01560 [Nevskiaceae bacterium]
MGACGVVGSGIGPEELQILTSTSQLFNEANTPVAAYTCVVEPVTASMVFTDGSRTNFSNSVDWTSSDPSVVTVVPQGIGVPAQLRPLKPGDVTITASYPRGSNPVLKKSVQVTVKALTDADLAIGKQDEPTLSFVPVDTTAGLTVAPVSTQLVQLAANESGITRNMTGQAQWNVCTDAGCAPATSLLNQFQNNAAASPLQWTKNPQTGANVQIHSILPTAAGQHFFLQATLGDQLAQDGTTATTFCAQPLVATVPLDVENLATIGITGQPDSLGSNTLGYGAGSDGLLPLVRGSSEAFTLAGTFANGQTQDLTLQGQFKSSDKTIADFNYQLFLGQAPTVPNPTPNILTALGSTAAGTTQVTAVFPPDNVDGTAPAGQLVSNALGVKTLDGKLQSISLVPTTPLPIQATDNINSVSLYALGTFLLADGTSFTQDVSRQTVWAVTNASGQASNSVVIVANGSPQAGTAAASSTNARGDTALVNAAITPLAGQCATGAQSCATLATGQTPNGPALTLTVNAAGDVPSPSSSSEPLSPPGSAPVQPVIANPGFGGSF